MRYIIVTETSELCDPDYGHIITEDLHVIKNQRLKKLFTKDPNFEEPQSLNYSRCKQITNRAIEEALA